MNRHAPVPTIEQQRDLKRLLAQDRAARGARKYRDAQLTYEMERNADVSSLVHIAQPEPVKFCAAPEADSDAALPIMFVQVLAALIAWGVFAWTVVSLFDAIRGAQ